MKNISLLVLIATCLAGCAQMNDKHDEFLARGETVYIGKVDSVQSFPGKERLLMKYWISDPRAKNITVYWDVNDASSRNIAVPEHDPSDALDILFEGTDGLAEGNYTFHWISSDSHGNKSMTFEQIASVYGPLYQEKLLNRRILETIPNDEARQLTIQWASLSSVDELGIELTYSTTGGEVKTGYYPSQLVTTLTLDNIDFTKGVTYRTLYAPDPRAIDTFYTEFARADIVKITNVARGKPARSSDDLNSTYPAEKAVDGQLGDASRWVSSAAGSEHWIEIDLQGEYSINSYAFWNGSSNNYSNNPLASFKLQAWVNNEWIDAHVSTTPNDGIFRADFPSVVTTKVRFISPSQTRIYELEVYSRIVY
jgi:hypothetical protein